MNKIAFLGITLWLNISCTTEENIRFQVMPQIAENPNSSVPLSAYLDFTTEDAFESITIQLKHREGADYLVFDWEEKEELGFPLCIIYPDNNYGITFELTDASGVTYQYHDTLRWQSPPLPGDPMEFPGVKIEQREAEQMAPGYTLMNPRRRVPLNVPGANEMNQSFGMLLAVDKQGQVVWYYRTDSRVSDFDILSDNTISYMTQDSRLTVIDMMGNVKRSWYAQHRPEGESDSAIAVDALTFHHDATFLPNGNVVVLSSEYKEISNYYTSETNQNAPRKTQQVMGDIIKEFTPQGEVVWEWKAFDYLDPYRIGYETFSQYWERRGFPGVIDWSHANTILYDQADDAYIINFRYQSALMKIDKKTKEIRWIFGEPSGWSQKLQNKLVKLEGEAEWFWHQHSPSLSPEGHILLFNNANYQARPFNEPVAMPETQSHVLEYAFDEEALTARQVWSSRQETDQELVSIAMGDVDYLPNGNLLAAYGALISQSALEEGSVDWYHRGSVPQWTMIREFEHSDSPQVIWELRLEPRGEESKVGWTIFGAERFVIE
jgi:hypothetical protein